MCVNGGVKRYQIERETDSVQLILVCSATIRTAWLSNGNISAVMMSLAAIISDKSTLILNSAMTGISLMPLLSSHDIINGGNPEPGSDGKCWKDGILKAKSFLAYYPQFPWMKLWISVLC